MAGESIEPRAALGLYERLIAAFIISAFLFAIAIKIVGALMRDEMESIYSEESLPLKKSYVTVEVAGAVNKPGRYQIEKGRTMRELLQMAEVRESADLRRINSDKKIVRRAKITIRERQSPIRREK